MTIQVFLRDVTVDDLPIFFAQQLDADANFMAAFTSRDPADRDAFMAHWSRIMSDPTIVTKTILAESKIAGNIACFGASSEREVGYWLGKEFWGKSVATQALAAFLAQATPRPLYAHVAKDNVASRRVLEKCGFVIIGEEKEFATARGHEIAAFVLKLSTHATKEIAP